MAAPVSSNREKWLASIRRTMESKDTADLLHIWEENDRGAWTEDAFEVIRMILEERGAPIPLQGSPGVRSQQPGLMPAAPPKPTAIAGVSQDDRIMAALSHVSILLPMTGLLVPVLIWVTHKEKSRYVHFQALQALALHLTLILAWAVGMGCYMASFFAFIPGAFLSDAINNAGPVGILFAFPFLIMGGMLLVGLAIVLYGLFGAVMTFQGRDFRYFGLGSLLEKQLSRNGAAQSKPSPGPA